MPDVSTGRERDGRVDDTHTRRAYGVCRTIEHRLDARGAIETHIRRDSGFEWLERAMLRRKIASTCRTNRSVARSDGERTLLGLRSPLRSRTSCQEAPNGPRGAIAAGFDRYDSVSLARNAMR